MKNQVQQGSSLVEVLVALFVLAIGLLGTLAMQTKSMQFNQSAHNYSKAVYFASDITERLKNYGELQRGSTGGTSRDTLISFAQYETDAPDAEPDCETNACALDDLAKHDLYQFTENVKTLPGGRASIETVAGDPNYVSVTIFFDDNRAAANSEVIEAPSEYKFRVKI